MRNGSTLHLTVKQSPPYAATQTVSSCLDPVLPAAMPPPIDASGVLYQGGVIDAPALVEVELCVSLWRWRTGAALA
jgi:hypothetical protein